MRNRLTGWEIGHESAKECELENRNSNITVPGRAL